MKLIFIIESNNAMNQSNRIVIETYMTFQTKLSLKKQNYFSFLTKGIKENLPKMIRSIFINSFDTIENKDKF